VEAASVARKLREREYRGDNTGISQLGFGVKEKNSGQNPRTF
jgi:hypothetical protein